MKRTSGAIVCNGMLPRPRYSPYVTRRSPLPNGAHELSVGASEKQQAIAVTDWLYNRRINLLGPGSVSLFLWSSVKTYSLQFDRGACMTAKG